MPESLVCSTDELGFFWHLLEGVIANSLSCSPASTWMSTVRIDAVWNREALLFWTVWNCGEEMGDWVPQCAVTGGCREPSRCWGCSRAHDPFHGLAGLTWSAHTCLSELMPLSSNSSTVASVLSQEAPSPLLPWGFCTCCSFCLECSSPRSLQAASFISAQMPPPHRGLTTHIKSQSPVPAYMFSAGHRKGKYGSTLETRV
jgi:hypothetical protein